MLINFREQAISFMLQAFAVASLSKARRRKVGALVVKEQKHGYFQTVSTGYNGTPQGVRNRCEDIRGTTIEGVVHAERNCLIKMQREGIATKDCTMVVTMIPCLDCCGRIIEAGIREVIYTESKTDSCDAEKSIAYLSNNGIIVNVIPKDAVCYLGELITRSLTQDVKFMETNLDSEYQTLVSKVKQVPVDKLIELSRIIDIVSNQSADGNTNITVLPLTAETVTHEAFLSWYEKVYERLDEKWNAHLIETCYSLFDEGYKLFQARS